MIPILTAVLMAGCGGAQKGSNAAAAPYPTDDSGMYMEEEMASAPSMEKKMAMGDESFSRDYDSVAAGGMTAQPAPPPAPYPDQLAVPDEPVPDTGAPTQSAADALIVYNGYLQLRVRSVLDTIDAITGAVKDRGGYVESLSGQVIIVRVPGDGFEQLMDQFATMGDLLNRIISAVEVTDQYFDLETRLQVAEESRTRLLALLERTTNTSQRLQILEEIKRLSEQIENMKASLSTLRNLIDYFTITVELVPVLEDGHSTSHQSPFSWVRSLSAHTTTIAGGAKAMSMKLPVPFVQFTEEKDFRAQAADTTTIRGGTVKNEPAGTATFWINAIAFEMEGRGEILEQSGKAGKMEYRLYRNDDVAPRWYLIAVRVQKDRVYVVETFYPDAAAFSTHHKDVLKALETLEVRK